MNWVWISAVVYMCSVFLYLLIRKVQLDGVHNRVYSFFMFAIPLAGTCIILLVQGTSFRAPFPLFLMIVGMSVLFSWLGNYVSQKSILLAPNPGYALIIFKSYVVLTSIAAVFLFGSEFTLKTGISIAMIVGFSALIIVEPKASRKHGGAWVLLAIAGFFCYGFLALSSKYLIDKGVDPVLMLFYIFLIVSLIMAGDLVRAKRSLRVPSKQLFLLVIIGVLALVFNVASWVGYKVAPNPGYINAVNAASISMVAVFSIILFRDEYSPRKLIGILGVTAGLVLLFLPL